MKNAILIALSILTLFTVSCSKDDDNGPSSTYRGVWSGTYTGAADNGTWKANVDAKGSITGEVSSNIYNMNLALAGTVSSQGQFDATVGSTSGGNTFKGQLTETTGSGTWKNVSGGTGTWKGNKN